MNKSVSFRDIRTDGFWKYREELNRTVSIPTVYDRFVDTGRFDAFKFEWKEDDDKQPHIFWDSDVAKWIESVAYSLQKHPDKNLEDIVDGVVSLIEKNQGDDGYFNIYFTVCEPDNRFVNRMAHELYCAGHLTEAAVAYYYATGKKTFLDCMCKYIDYIEKVFKIEDSAEFCTPGHEEIELALVKLYDCTKEERYLELAKWFVDKRGTCQKDFDSPYYISHAYDQSHIPVREMSDADGHSVRAMYLYCAMADLALKTGEKAMFDACRRLFESTATKRMYITGGIGSTPYGEAFSTDYDLPNELAYSESCAAIGLALFARRMSLLDADSLYADVAERAIYNGFLSSTSLDGKAFFYENPLEINLKNREIINKFYNTKQHWQITQRLEVFDCSCCPPNITRFVASIGDFLYTYNDSAVFVHHYMASDAEFDGITVKQTTDYPLNGKIAIKANGLGGRQLAVRVPAWCDNPVITVDGKAFDGEIKKGYAYISAADGADIVLDFEMKVALIQANPRVKANIGKVAVTRGPVVYCLEGVDNGENLDTLFVNSKDIGAKLTYNEAMHAYTLETNGFVLNAFDSLYRTATDDMQEKTLKFIPYFAFANRGETDLLVWCNVK